MLTLEGVGSAIHFLCNLNTDIMIVLHLLGSKAGPDLPLCLGVLTHRDPLSRGSIFMPKKTFLRCNIFVINNSSLTREMILFSLSAKAFMEFQNLAFVVLCRMSPRPYANGTDNIEFPTRDEDMLNIKRIPSGLLMETLL